MKNFLFASFVVLMSMGSLPSAWGDSGPSCQFQLQKQGDAAAKQSCEQASHDFGVKNYAGAVRVLEQLFAHKRASMSDPVLRYLSAMYGSAVQGAQLEDQVRQRLIKASATDHTGWTQILLSNMVLTHIAPLTFRNQTAVVASNVQQEQIHQRINDIEHPHQDIEDHTATIKTVLIVLSMLLLITFIFVHSSSFQVRYAVLGGIWGAALGYVEWNVPVALIFLNVFVSIGNESSIYHLLPNLIVVFALLGGCIEWGRRYGLTLDHNPEKSRKVNRFLYFLFVLGALPIIVALPITEFLQSSKHKREAEEFRKSVTDHFEAVAPQMTSMHLTPSWDHYQIQLDLNVYAKLDGQYKLGVQVAKSESEPFFEAAESYRSVLLGANTISNVIFCYDLISPDFRISHPELKEGGPPIRQNTALMTSLAPVDPMKMFQGQSLTIPYDPDRKPLNLQVNKTYPITLDITTDGTSILCTPINPLPERSSPYVSR